MPAPIARLTLHLLKVPLTHPYRLSFVTLDHVDALVVEAVDAEGRTGIGESTIQPGYTPETLDGAWDFAIAAAPGLVGLPADEAGTRLAAIADRSPNAASALATAVATLGAPPLAETLRLPLLAPVHGEDAATLPAEIAGLLARGYRTLKVKAGFDAVADRRRVDLIRAAVAGRATLRIDANGGFSREQALAFLDGFDPAGVELLEQPCAAADWDGNAAVAARSPVPVMLDESIYGLAGIDRAAALAGVGFVKLKLKKIGSPAQLRSALARIRALGLTPVIGDGTGTDIAAWHEAVAAAGIVDTAGEMNGFLKTAVPLLTAGPRFADGFLELAAGLSPVLNPEALSRTGVRRRVVDPP